MSQPNPRIIPGLVSVTFRSLSPDAILALAVRAQLEAIEWGGDVHVPAGNIPRAQEVARQTRDAGLQTSAYGSYYRLGISESAGLPFASVLDTAAALQTQVIRVWPGNQSSADATQADRFRIVTDAQRIADLAAQASLYIALEFHIGTLTDTAASTVQLLRDINRPNVHTYWQPPTFLSPADRLATLREVLPWVTNIHAFHWLPTPDGKERRPLADGTTEWADYLTVLRHVPADRVISLEFVRNDTPDQLLQDAATLHHLLASP